MDKVMEKKFFEAFGIEKNICDFINEYGECKCAYGYINKKDKSNCQFANYPPITAEIILGLIEICCKFHHDNECCYLICGDNKEKIIERILKDCIEFQPEIQTQVQELFNQAKEGVK